MSSNVPVSPVSLSEFLVEADLSHFSGIFKNVLRVERVDQLKFVADADLQRINMLPVEQRRLKKFLNKYYPQSYLDKFVKILHSKSNSSSSVSVASTPSSRRNSGVDQWTDTNKGKDRGHFAGSQHSAGPIIPINSIAFQEVIFKGICTSVHRALWTHSSLITEVAVKKTQREWHQSDFLADVAVLMSIEHRCIVRFYGVVLENELSVWLVTEIAANRSLLECLRDPLLKSSLPVLVLCDMALQICEGMQYLEHRGLFHGNLGARNVLVFRELRVKVADVCFPHGESLDGDVNKLTAWLAPECYSGQNRSSVADVWAYGVTLWEMFSFGAQPFAGFTDQQIKEIVRDPYFRRLDQPDWCPRDYYNLMLKCWCHEKCDRLTFQYLYTALSDCKPEQLQVVSKDTSTPVNLDRKILQCSIGDVIVVLDNDPDDGLGLWKGVIENRKSGLFNPSNTVTYLGADVLPSAALGENRLTYARSSLKSLGKYKINRNQISRPQGDFRHVGHVGLDGAHFGDVSLITSGNAPKSLSSLSRPSSRTPLSESRLSSTSSLVTLESSSSRSTPDNQKISQNGFTGQAMITNKKDLRISVPIRPQVEGHVNYGSNLRTASNIPDSDDRNFRLDLGPSLMDEVFRVFNNSSSFSAPSHCSSEVLSDKAPLTLNCSEPSTPSEPISPSHPVCSLAVTSLAHPEIKPEVTAKLDTPSKPTAPPRKKTPGLKPVSSRDEKVLDNFINVSNQMTAKRDTMAGDKNSLSPSMQTENTLKSRFSFRGFRNKIGTSSDSLLPSSPRIIPERGIISKPVELTDLITDESKEAYRALVEEGACTKATTSSNTSIISDQDEVDSDATSPLKLLRRGAGSSMVYKASSSRPGRAVGGFSRGVSHDPSPPAELEVLHHNDDPRSFLESNGNADVNLVSVQDLNFTGKKTERPTVPPPLPPRDRSKPLLLASLKPRERKYPLLLPENDCNTNFADEEDSAKGTSPEPGLVCEVKSKSPTKQNFVELSMQQNVVLSEQNKQFSF